MKRGQARSTESGDSFGSLATHVGSMTLRIRIAPNLPFSKEVFLYLIKFTQNGSLFQVKILQAARNLKHDKTLSPLNIWYF